MKIDPISYECARDLHWWPWGDSFAPGSSTLSVDPSQVDLAKAGELLRSQPIEVMADWSGRGLVRIFTHRLLSADVRSDAAALRGVGALSGFDAKARGAPFPADVDEGVRDTTQPFLIGVARSIPAVMAQVGSSVVWVSDAPMGAIIAVRDRGIALTPSADPPPSGGYARVRAGRAVRLGTPPLHPVTVDASGYGAATAPVGDVLAGYGGWPQPWATTPPGWTVHAGAVAEHLLEGSARQCMLRIAGQQTFGGIEQDLSLTTPLALGSAYRLLVRVSVVRGAGWRVRTSSGQVWMTRSDSGVFIADVAVESGPSSQSLVVEVIGGQGAFIVIDELRCTLIDPTPPVVVEGPTLEEMVQAIAARVGMSTAGLLVGAVPRYRVGFHVEREARGLDLLRLLLDTWAATAIERRDGTIAIQRIEPPETLMPKGWITPDMMTRAPVCELDRAPGLTTRVGVQKNCRVLSGGDLADAVPPAWRAQLTQPYRVVVQSSVQLPSVYRRAADAAILDTAHDDPDAARAEIDRVARIYTRPRWIHRVSVDPALTGLLPEVGDVLAVVAGDLDDLTPRWTRLLVIGCRDVYRDGRLSCELTLWG
jgi:hypothetical protein